MALRALFRNPTAFSTYIISSPSIWWNDREEHRMVDNATELAARLAKLDPSNVVVVRTVFEGETHGSVPPTSLMRGLRFALQLN